MADPLPAAEGLESAEQSLALLRAALDSFAQLNDERSPDRQLALLTDILEACESVERLPEPNGVVLMDSRLLAASARVGLASLGFRAEEQLAGALHQCIQAARTAYEVASYSGEAQTLRASIRLLLDAVVVAEETVARDEADVLAARGEEQETGRAGALVDSLVEAIAHQTLRLRLVMEEADREQQMGIDLLRMERDLVVLAAAPADGIDHRDLQGQARILAEAAGERFVLAGDEVMLSQVRTDISSIDEALSSIVDRGVPPVEGAPEVESATPSAVAAQPAVVPPPEVTEPTPAAAAAEPTPAAAPSYPAPLSTEPWYYLAGGSERGGPIPRGRLEELFAHGRLPSGTLVWKTGMPEWRKPEEFGFAAAPAPTPPAAPTPSTTAGGPHGPAAVAPARTATPSSAAAAPPERAGADTGEGWYVGRQGERYGPYTLAHLRGFVGEGRLAPDDLVWHPILSTWMTLEHVRSRVPGLL